MNPDVIALVEQHKETKEKEEPHPVTAAGRGRFPRLLTEPPESVYLSAIVNTRAWPGAWTWSRDGTVCDGSVFVYHLNIWSPRVTNTAASHAVTSGRPRMRREEEQGPAGGDSHIHLHNFFYLL